MTVRDALSRKSLSASAMWSFGANASSPMVVLAGGIVATYAATGVVGVPLAFLMVAAVLLLLSVPYTELARRVPHSAVYYAVIARGLGGHAGVAAGMVSLVFYNAIQISLFGLLGATLTDLVGGVWWVWAYLALLLVAALGVRNIVLSARVSTVVLVVSVVVVVLFAAAGLADPAGGSASGDGFAPSSLFVAGYGGAFALCLAAFVGFEVPASFGEEARDEAAVPRSVTASILFLGGLYTVTAWAMGVAVGPGNVASRELGGMPFALLEDRYGWAVSTLGELTLVAGIFTAMLAFHAVVARYGFAMAQEGVLPAFVHRTGTASRAGAPTGGSILQTGIAAVVLTGFVVFRADPLTGLFTWLSTLAAFGFIALLLVVAIAALRYLNRHDNGERATAWTRLAAPVLGLITGAVLLGMMVVNAGLLLGTAPGSPLPYLLPVGLLVIAVGGVLWADHLATRRRAVFAAIGRGKGDPLAVPEPRLRGYRL